MIIHDPCPQNATISQIPVPSAVSMASLPYLINFFSSFEDPFFVPSTAEKLFIDNTCLYSNAHATNSAIALAT